MQKDIFQSDIEQEAFLRKKRNDLLNLFTITEGRKEKFNIYKRLKNVNKNLYALTKNPIFK